MSEQQTHLDTADVEFFKRLRLLGWRRLELKF
jgi:hypothetical protein